MNKSTFLKGTVILTVATLTSKVLGSIFRIPLQNIAGDEVLGIFSLVYPVYMVALILSVAGIPTAISKLISEARVKNPEHIYPIYRTAGILSLIFGVASFSLIVIFSKPIAEALGGSDTRLSLIIVASTLLVAPYMAVYRGYFQGFEDMRPTGISQVIEQFIRVCLIIVLAYVFVAMGKDDAIVAGVVMVGSIFGALASLLYLKFKYWRSTVKAKKTTYAFSTFKRWSKIILSTSIPIAIGSLTMALLNFVDSFTITYGLKQVGFTSEQISAMYGIYSRGVTLVQIATVFSSSMVLSLIPLITKQMAERNLIETKKAIEKTHFVAHLISWPAAIGLFALSLPLNLGLFTDLQGSMMLSIIHFSSVFTSLTLLGTGILQGMNKARVAAFVILVGVGLKTVFNIVLVQWFGLNGAALSTLLVYLFLYGLNTGLIYKNISFTIFNKQHLKMVLAAIVMGGLIGIPTLYFDIESWSRLEAVGYVSLAIVVGGAVYFFQLFLYNVVNQRDVSYIRGLNTFVTKFRKEKK
ncbi:putative polysaccharide biosynthesis protein [Fervidibacillus albus]|uniref:Polysaccharide biosynthesis protein n=1 Tax=Fervidibacillus albus TaxID=2980026 RepID=A0A9E8LUQ1_9BACI|nr:polysaccharide biosynthesis protein [Fervidibacillus albus]WAA09695.1 polysaccharide biosynthesis protein [Fervidibacillus albus]